MKLFRRGAKVTMLVSYGEDLVAGREYRLDPDLADSLIVKGFAVGETSDRLTPELAEQHRSQVQKVGF